MLADYIKINIRLLIYCDFIQQNRIVVNVEKYVLYRLATPNRIRPITVA